jgi:hypothetical protein
MYWMQPTSGRDNHEENERSQGSHFGSSGFSIDDDVLAIYWESFGHPNRIRSMVFQCRQKTRHSRIHSHGFPRRTSMRMRKRRFYLRLPSTRFLIRQAMNSKKPVKRVTKQVRHVPIPGVLKLMKPEYVKPWHPLSKKELARRHRMARMNRCRAWSKRFKKR